jgi:PAS domain S-box-containing protein
MYPSTRECTPASVPETREQRIDPIELATLRAFVETSSDAMFALDLSEHIVSWNRSAERIFGYDATEVLGCQVVTLFPDHLRDWLATVLDAVRAGDRVDHVEIEMRRKDGMPIPVALAVSPVCGPDGEVDGISSVARDITEQQLAQANLGEMGRRLSEAEAAAHTGRWLWDVATGAVQWSDELHRIMGIEPMEFEGTIDAHLAPVHADDRDAVRHAIEHAVRTGRPFDAEYRIVEPTGEVRWVHSRGEVAISSTGAVIGVRAVCQVSEPDASGGR